MIKSKRKDLKLFSPEAVQINKTRGRPIGASRAQLTKLEEYLKKLDKYGRMATKNKNKHRIKLTKLLGKFEEAPEAQKIYSLFIEPFLRAMKEHGYEDGKRITEWLFSTEARKIHTLIVDQEFKMPGKVLGIATTNINRAAKNGDALIVAEIDEDTRHVFNVELIHQNYDLHTPAVFQLTKSEFAGQVLPRCVKG